VEENITEEVLDKKINELVASRGRKNTDPREVLRKLEVLSKSARPLGKRGTIFLSCNTYASPHCEKGSRLTLFDLISCRPPKGNPSAHAFDLSNVRLPAR
jgi:hypothetical protein